MLEWRPLDFAYYAVAVALLAGNERPFQKVNNYVCVFHAWLLMTRREKLLPRNKKQNKSTHSCCAILPEPYRHGSGER